MGHRWRRRGRGLTDPSVEGYANKLCKIWVRYPPDCICDVLDSDRAEMTE